MTHAKAATTLAILLGSLTLIGCSDNHDRGMSSDTGYRETGGQTGQQTQISPGGMGGGHDAVVGQPGAGLNHTGTSDQNSGSSSPTGQP